MEDWISGLNMLLHRSVEGTVPCEGSLQVVTGRLLCCRLRPHGRLRNLIPHSSFILHT